MTPTDEIDDPTWHDIFDRDNEIAKLNEKLSRVLDALGKTISDFDRCDREKDALIEGLLREIERLREKNGDEAAHTCEESGC